MDTTAPSTSAGSANAGPDNHQPLNPTLDGLDLRHYELLDRLGSGGMGEVYRSTDPGLGRDLAIKVLRPDLRGNSEMERRFELEARITGSLQHPGIVPVYNVGRLRDGRIYFTMKLVRGKTFAEILRERDAGKLERYRSPLRSPENIRQVVAYTHSLFLVPFEKVCQAVAYAHSRGVIHRDLKPANIMVGAFGEVQVMDWGLAKILDQGSGGPTSSEVCAPDAASSIGKLRTLTPGVSSQAGTVMGTPTCMAPEQARGEVDRLDQRCDVFGLGAILCTILTRQPPFQGASCEELFRQAANGDLADAFTRLDDCGMDAELVALAKECLAPEPAGRPRDAGVVAERVTAHLVSVQEQMRAAEVGQAAAKARARAELKRFEEQAAAFPAIPVYRAGLALCQSTFATMLSCFGDAAEALAWHDQAIALLTPLVEAEPRLARERKSWYHRVIALLSPAVEAEPGLGEEARQCLVNAHLGRAMTLAQLERHADAAAEYNQAVDVSHGSQKAMARACRAHFLVCTGQVDRAVAEAADLAKATEADAMQVCSLAGVYALAAGRDQPNREGHVQNALHLLRRAVAEGFEDAEQLKQDDDFTSLRAHGDFKRLLAELKNKSKPNKP